MAKMLSLILWVTMGYFLTGQVGAMTHIVGGSFGWRFPANTSFYQAWAKPRNFTSGDKLIFLYTTGLHNVLEVKKEDYDDCTQNHVIKKYDNGPAIFEVTKPGDHYFICGLKNHCQNGERLKISVMKGGESSGGGGIYGMITKSSANSIHNSIGMLSGLLLVLFKLLI
ncbi:mavicyanin-like [Quercus lobata]|uniref:Phytocyanin domain-containing protein n=1 Tax=Quercus lobata TaxID=97700 RepID=A0A7N2RAF8_QUELO|nr:mavicyanin-like [Quercus lobata]